MDLADYMLSKEAIRAKYPGGSPDYPTHATGCPCSGCYASWTEWRSGYAAAEAMRAEHAEAMRLEVAKRAAWATEVFRRLGRVITLDLDPAARALLARVEALEAMAKYTGHTDQCATSVHPEVVPCDCGYWEALDKLRELDVKEIP